MELELNSIMMIIFIIVFIISIWKISPFLQTKTLEDDDTTEASQRELLRIIQKYITNEELSSKELFEKVKSDPEFDKKHFWRFNENKLKQILNKLN